MGRMPTPREQPAELSRSSPDARAARRPRARREDGRERPPGAGMMLALLAALVAVATVTVVMAVPYLSQGTARSRLPGSAVLALAGEARGTSTGATASDPAADATWAAAASAAAGAARSDASGDADGKTSTRSSLKGDDNASTSDASDRAGDSGAPAATPDEWLASGDASAGRTDEGAANGVPSEGGELDASSGGGVGLTVSRDGGSLEVDLAGVEGPATVELTLSEGTATAPGVYAHSDGLVRLTPGTLDGHTVLTMEVAGPCVVTVDVASWGDARGYELAVLYDADGSELARSAAEGAAMPARMAALLAAPPISAAYVQTMDFRFNGYHANAATEHDIPRIASAADGTTAYCNDMMRNAPGDPAHGGSGPVTYYAWYFSGDPYTAHEQGQNYLDFIAFHGYPVDPTINGLCADAQAAEAATQWAIWNFTNPGSTPTSEAPYESWGDQFWNAYYWLVNAAVEYDQTCLSQGATNQTEYGTCLVWTTADSTLQSVLSFAPRYGWIDLQKRSSSPELVEGGGVYSLQGASFEARDASGAVQATMTTDANGYASARVPVGNYQVVETTAPSGFELNAAAVQVSVSGGPVHVRAEVTDQPILGEIEVMKRAPDSSPVASALLAVTSVATGEQVALMTTDESGHATTGRSLPLGDYEVRETSAPDGYGIASPVTVSLGVETQVVSLEMEDPWTTWVSIAKVDAEGGDAVAGATLQLLDAGGAIIDEWVSELVPHDVRGIAPGEYTLRETAAPAGYDVAPEKEFTLPLGSACVSVEMADVRTPVDVSFAKVDAMDGTPLEGATFALYRCVRPSEVIDGRVTREQELDETLWTLVSTATSDARGQVDLGQVKEGTYLLVETQAPQGYATPRDGWVVIADSEAGQRLHAAGEGAAPEPQASDGGSVTIGNRREYELPAAGGTGSSRAVSLAAGGASACASCCLGAALCLRARRRC